MCEHNKELLANGETKTDMNNLDLISGQENKLNTKLITVQVQESVFLSLISFFILTYFCSEQLHLKFHINWMQQTIFPIWNPKTCNFSKNTFRMHTCIKHQQFQADY